MVLFDAQKLFLDQVNFVSTFIMGQGRYFRGGTIERLPLLWLRACRGVQSICFTMAIRNMHNLWIKRSEQITLTS